MTKYAAMVLLDVDKVFKGRKQNRGDIKAFLENRIMVGDVDELFFRKGKVIMNVREVKIVVTEIN